MCEFHTPTARRTLVYAVYESDTRGLFKFGVTLRLNLYLFELLGFSLFLIIASTGTRLSGLQGDSKIGCTTCATG